MSLSSTSTLKGQLTRNLGSQAPVYFDSLSNFVSGKTSRQEFEDTAKSVLVTPTLRTTVLIKPTHKLNPHITVQLHNALIISLFDATATLKRPPTPPLVTLPKPPPTKRRRLLLPYQGPDTSDISRSIRSARIKRWTLSMGRRERERLKSLHVQPSAPSATEHLRPKKNTDEISSERGVELLNERGGMYFIIFSHIVEWQLYPLQTLLEVDYLSTFILVHVLPHCSTLLTG